MASEDISESDMKQVVVDQNQNDQSFDQSYFNEQLNDNLTRLNQRNADDDGENLTRLNLRNAE